MNFAFNPYEVAKVFAAIDNTVKKTEHKNKIKNNLSFFDYAKDLIKQRVKQLQVIKWFKDLSISKNRWMLACLVGCLLCYYWKCYNYGFTWKVKRNQLQY